MPQESPLSDGRDDYNGIAPTLTIPLRRFSGSGIDAPTALTFSRYTGERGCSPILSLSRRTPGSMLLQGSEDAAILAAMMRSRKGPGQRLDRSRLSPGKQGRAG
jgi:hypothetical protein